MNGIIRGLALIAFMIAPAAFAEDETRDFYAEPGMNPFKTSAGQDSTENIDPFSGNVQLSYVDLSIPGNGGLDINITRFYNLPQGSPGYANPFGYGWTMHFGRITIGSGHANQLCGTGAVPGGDTLDNPSIEMPDGGRELLVHSAALNDGTYITRSNWKAQCIDPTDYSRGIVATAPNGTAYYMREYVFMQGEDGPAGEPAPTVETWLTNRIVDVHGNSIDVTYLAIANGMKLITRLDSSDGRQVLFEYLDPGDVPVTASSTNARLHSISANGQAWYYEYAPVEGVATGWGAVHHYELTSVTRPDNTRWQYAYGDTITEPEFNRLNRVVYPGGGVIDYSYQWVRPYLPNPDFRIVSIESKTQENPGHATGTWTYEFHPGHTDFAELGVQPLPENAGRMADFTRITTPVGEEHIYHVGYWALVNTHDILWQMGLKIIHRNFEPESGGGLKLVRSLSNSWDIRRISDEISRGGILSALWDGKVYAPVLTRRNITLDGFTYATDYADYDAFGNPGTVTEWAIYPTEGGNRITDFTYINDTSAWTIGLPAAESVTQDDTLLGTINRSYNDRGQKTSEDRFGVLTRYSYTPEGDLAAVTDALDHTTAYENYFRGQARQEGRPDGSRITRTVNPTGTIASKTSARGHITSFTYDGLNRLTGISFPRGHDVSVSYRANGKSLTRGPYREDINWDGFGRETDVIRYDLATGEQFTRHYDHDALGRRVFESDVNSSQGVARGYDSIDRITRVTHQDQNSRSITYQGAHREVHRDENGNQTDYLYQVYGSPERRFLSWILSPESVGTHIGRDAYGNITSVFQGGLDPANPAQYLGYTQTYTYNSRLQLTAVDSPADIGTTLYGRDLIGNMTSRQVGSGNIANYTYDSMNRISSADYADDTIDVSYSYDEDGNPTSLINSFASRNYSHDENGNLSAEDIDTGGALYSLRYNINDLDHIDAIHYPSGRTLDYAPNALGRATRALPYLSSVSYFPNGSLKQLDYANGRSVTYTNTVRNWIDTIDMGSLLGLNYYYDSAGNVTTIDDQVDPSASRTMSYDDLHRLSSATGMWGTATYAYDAYSNLIRKSDPARNNRDQYYHYLGLLLDRMTYSGSPAQRVFSHDDAGNITYNDDAIFDPFTGLPEQVLTRRTQFFDDAGNMTFAQRGAKDDTGNTVPLRSGSFSSEYDASNNRIRKINHSDNNRITDYAYSRAGLLLGEYDAAGPHYGNEYFYLGSQQIATAKYNVPPGIDVGEDIQATGGAVVTISATSSDLDGEIISVQWSQISGPPVAFDNANASDTFFDAPRSEEEATIVLQYTATDDRGGSATGTLSVTIEADNSLFPVSQLAVLPGGSENIVIWEPVADATGYRVYSTSDQTLPTDTWNQSTTTKRHFSHSGVETGTEYFYRIEAFNASGTAEISPLVSATPGNLSWQPAHKIPEEQTALDSLSTRIAGNRYGEAVILSEREESGTFRLYAWQYSPPTGWGTAALVNEGVQSHYFPEIDIDDDGNVLLAWAEGSIGSRSLYSAYRLYGKDFLPPQLVEHYAPNEHVDGDVVAVSHLEFTDSGQAYLCWRQNRLHVFNNYFDAEGSSALIKRFDPDLGWTEERTLELANNVGDTRNLSCDVAGNGLVIAAWERYNTYDPQPISFGGREYDVWVTAFNPDTGWTGSETVEFIETGERESGGNGIQNYLPRATASNAGYGVVVWYNQSETNIESIEYDFGASTWLPRDTLESRANRVPSDGSQRIDSSRQGDLLVSWGDRYRIRPANNASWDRARSWPATPIDLGLDDLGQPFSVHLEAEDVVANRNIDGAWQSHQWAGSTGAGASHILSASTGAHNALRVYWALDSTLYSSSDQLPSQGPDDDSGPDTTAPSTLFTADASRIKGTSRYDITLQADEPGQTFFRFSGQGRVVSGGQDNQDWQHYLAPVGIQLSKKGAGLFEFYSEDTAGNVETTQTENLQ